MPPLTQEYSFSTQSGYLTSSQYAQNSSSNPVDGVRRVTIRQLLLAEETNDEHAPFNIDGVSVNKVMLVANVHRNDAEPSGEKISYGFDDGTGRISGNRAPLPGGDPAFRSFAYARVTGYLAKYRNAKYLRISHIVPISDFYEVYYHILQTIAETVALERGPPSPEFLQQLATADQVDSLAQNLYRQASISQLEISADLIHPWQPPTIVSTTQDGSSPISVTRPASPEYASNSPALTLLEQDVLYCIDIRITRDNAGTGVHVSEFIPLVQQRNPDLTSSQLKGAISFLLENGLITTMDDEHYLSIYSS